MEQLLISLETAAKSLDMPLEVFIDEVLPALDVYCCGDADYIRPEDLRSLINTVFGQDFEGVVIELFPDKSK
jgi:hypothetical protein